MSSSRAGPEGLDITAAVVAGPGRPFELRQLVLEPPRPDEVLVRIAGVGICHTDLVAQAGGLPLALPAVLGHEGAGIVERVGERVRRFRPGDRVAATFLSCGSCPSCGHDAPAYCDRFSLLNIGGTRADGSRTLRDGAQAVSGSFFGQSSFATHALAHERNLVAVPDAMPLELAGVFGCGVQTGAGAVLRSMDCKPGSSLVVLGGGAVGLSAVMAARVRGLGRIIVSEQHAARRALALELGATDVVDPSAGELAGAVLALLPAGADCVLDTTGIPAVIERVPHVLARRGTFGFVGIPPTTHPHLPLPGTLMDAMRRGWSFRGIIAGDSNLAPFIESLMRLHLDGEFPVDRMVRTFALSRINEAIEAQHRGECVKAVLVP